MFPLNTHFDSYIRIFNQSEIFDGERQRLIHAQHSGHELKIPFALWIFRYLF